MNPIPNDANTHDHELYYLTNSLTSIRDDIRSLVNQICLLSTVLFTGGLVAVAYILQALLDNNWDNNGIDFQIPITNISTLVSQDTIILIAFVALMLLYMMVIGINSLDDALLVRRLQSLMVETRIAELLKMERRYDCGLRVGFKYTTTLVVALLMLFPTYIVLISLISLSGVLQWGWILFIAGVIIPAVIDARNRPLRTEPQKNLWCILICTISVIVYNLYFYEASEKPGNIWLMWLIAIFGYFVSIRWFTVSSRKMEYYGRLALADDTWSKGQQPLKKVYNNLCSPPQIIIKRIDYQLFIPAGFMYLFIAQAISFLWTFPDKILDVMLFVIILFVSWNLIIQAAQKIIHAYTRYKCIVDDRRRPAH